VFVAVVMTVVVMAMIVITATPGGVVVVLFVVATDEGGDLHGEESVILSGLEFLGGVDLFIELEAEFTRASVLAGWEVSFELGVGQDAFDAFCEEAFLEESGVFLV
jgi:hypothetical protein